MKKLILLTFASVLALHISVANAQDNTSTVKTKTSTEECVIKVGDQ